MKFRDLSKLQIRSEIMHILQNLNSLDEMSKDQQDSYLNSLRSIRDIDYVVEILVKELVKVDFKKGQIISLFIQELANLESIKDTLWSYIKSNRYPDEIKDLAGIILKNLGDQAEPEEFLNYLEDPKALVDKETQKLLEVASINPEAQIDFLDFLFSLPESEQLNLVSSLKDDYSSEYLVNVVAPALEARPSANLEESLIDILGETRSALAVPVLNDVLKYSKSEITKKRAKKSLNMLKLAGIDINIEHQDNFVSPITKLSDIYECHTNIVDGVGNQGFIISRIKPNHDILMMNVVLNDVHGIIDCFGFYGISKQDFSKIIDKFQEKSTRFLVSPEYCKLRLEEAEKINKENNLPISYEYTAWKSLISDISPIDNNIEQLYRKWISKDLINETILLYKFPDFQYWFFEEEDHPYIAECLPVLIHELTNKTEYFINNKDNLKIWLESNINKILPEVFSEEIKNIYKNRLLDLTYIFNCMDLQRFRNIAASLAWSLTPENSYDINRLPFFREMIKKTIIEGLLRANYKINQPAEDTINLKKPKQATNNKIHIEDDSFIEIINVLCKL